MSPASSAQGGMTTRQPPVYSRVRNTRQPSVLYQPYSLDRCGRCRGVRSTRQSSAPVPTSSSPTSQVTTPSPRGFGSRYRANMAHLRQSRQDSGLDFQVKVLKRLQVVPFLLGSGDLIAGGAAGCEVHDNHPRPSRRPRLQLHRSPLLPKLTEVPLLLSICANTGE